MNASPSERATAHHEAGHVAALNSMGLEVESVEVTTAKSGVTNPLTFPTRDEDIVFVALAGIQAEADCDKRDDIQVGIDMYLGGSEDRDLIDQRAHMAWINHGSNSLWRQAQYNRAMKFVITEKNRIDAIATALLVKKGYPKKLGKQEIKNLL